eukprot:CAMPEP_0170569752 /NCGR_PEP_ID=MMETSP0224-20130122/729_1 /TAXON_ID=285029 /ORGANISM="Togula jolla, Strain CCCM 725" /LENGTH=83 /DNA_ID=CAMNT_0010891953 /DNA_START=30 /DNA_END=281 /DNA_ORIENTATION=-
MAYQASLSEDDSDKKQVCCIEYSNDEIMEIELRMEQADKRRGDRCATTLICLKTLNGAVPALAKSEIWQRRHARASIGYPGQN